MYVVRRAFKCNGHAYLPGSVVELGSIKRAKSRLNDRYIVEVTAKDFDAWNEYFKEKFGCTIQVPDAAAMDASTEEPKVPEAFEAPVEAARTVTVAAKPVAVTAAAAATVVKA